MAGHTLLRAWLKAQDAGPEPTWGLCRQLPVSSVIYLSICIDNQRINDLCFFFFFHLVVCSKKGNVSVLPQMPSLVAATLGSVWWHMPYRNSFVALGQITQGPWAVTVEGALWSTFCGNWVAQIQHPVWQHFLNFKAVEEASRLLLILFWQSTAVSAALAHYQQPHASCSAGWPPSLYLTGESAPPAT